MTAETLTIVTTALLFVPCVIFAVGMFAGRGVISAALDALLILGTSFIVMVAVQWIHVMWTWGMR